MFNYGHYHPKDFKILFLRNLVIWQCAEYRLLGLVSHMGTSTQCGHYVAHIYKNGRWVIFNDEKVGASKDPPKDMGYLYFFERINN